MNCTKLIACSSAECERGFGLMNIIKQTFNTTCIFANVHQTAWTIPQRLEPLALRFNMVEIAPFSR
ncbi:hypothetical protein PR048_020608 [Dryococelus australis]|uniref:Uncharacterized protein n=1 Tax=Dryococelus australis TaxID=614101 RepID=A0ABQ9H6V0_9NEOP|nr:hypothetical protein PR048_020608 [Dryococelus australis]